ncbi:MAG: hypothetical protein GY716_13615 [bacterium]|nr:hypothetical protein [bacterium]
MDAQREQCARCLKAVPPYSGVHQSDGKGNDLGFVCGRCWTEILSKHSGEHLDFLELEPVVVSDARGAEHEFHFRYNPIPCGVQAFELEDGVPGGYQFAVLAEDDESSDAMVARLMTKMRRGLKRRHVESGGIHDKTVRGRIEWDEEQGGRIPRVVVDGISLSWDDLGEMLMSFEGWQFRLEIADPADEV